MSFGDTTVDADAVQVDEDGREPVELLSRLYAHIGHRIPLINRVEKRFEGQDKTSGMASDLFAFLVQVGKRNKPALEYAFNAFLEAKAMEKAMQDQLAFDEAEAQRRATEAGDGSPTGNGNNTQGDGI